MNSSATDGLLDAALSYLAGGLSLVPCSPETKRPDPDLCRAMKPASPYGDHIKSNPRVKIPSGAGFPAVARALRQSAARFPAGC